MPKKYYCIPFLVFGFWHLIYSQPGNLFIRNFPPASYLAPNGNLTSPQNFAIIEDNRGVMYVANATIVMEYDGISWRNVVGTAGINNAWNFAKNSSGRIFFGTDYELGFIASDSAGTNQFHSLKDSLPQEDQSDPISKTFSTYEGIQFVTPQKVFTWNGTHFITKSFEDSIKNSFSINGRLFLLLNKTGLCVFENEKTTLIDNSPLWYSAKVVDLLSFSDIVDSIDWWVVTSQRGIYHFHGKELTPVKTSDDQLLKSSILNCSLKLPDHSIALGTDYNGIIIINQEGKIIQRINKNCGSGLYNNKVHNLYYDSGGGLWAANDQGVSRTDYPLPLRFFDSSNGLDGIVSAVLLDANTLWVGTNSGLYHLKLNQEEQSFIKENSISETWAIRKMDGEIFIATAEGLFVANGNKIEKLDAAKCFGILPSEAFPGKIYVGEEDGISVFSYTRGKLHRIGKINGITHQVNSMKEDTAGNLWVAYAQVSYLNFNHSFSLSPQVLLLDSVNGYDLGTMVQLEVFKIKNHIYFGTSIGLFHFDEQQQKLEHDTTFGKRFGTGSAEAYELTEDKTGGIWLTSEFHNGRLTNETDHYLWDTIPLARLSSASVWNIFVDDDNVVWYGTTNGLYRLDQSLQKNYHAPFNTLIRSVTINEKDTLFGGTYYDSLFNAVTIQPKNLVPVLKYSDNNVSLEYAGLDFNSNEGCEYTTWLEGKDVSWSGWSYSTKRDFTNLHEGKYVFHAKAKNIYGVEGNEATYAFEISPPIQRTWYAYIIYLLLLAVFIWLIIQLNYRRLIASHRRLESKVEERTNEINHQKEIIEAEKQKVEKKSIELEQLISDLKLAQDQLIQSEKMASLGQLTAGIAHEINNPINFVSANIPSLKRNFDEIKSFIAGFDQIKLSPDQQKQLSDLRQLLQYDYSIQETDQLLNGLQEGANRTASIVKGLRNFSRLDENELKEVDINEGIESTLVLLSSKLKGKNINLVKKLNPVHHISAYYGQLNQVWMNIINNAIDAVSEEGRIEIISKEENNYIRVSISDTGEGMPDEVKKKIFDPFFTTKDVGKGTGLGLSISYGIIEKHKGKIEVKSVVGKGTEFTILLPLKQSE